MKRRDILTYGLGMAAGVAAGAFAPRGAEAQAVPAELGDRVEYFYHATEGFQTNDKGETTFTTDLKRGDIMVFFSQKVETGGVVWEVDSAKNPSLGQVVAVIATTDVEGYTYKTFPGRYVWKTRERSKSQDFQAMMEDAVRAGQVQVARAQIPGNCTPAGCVTTQLSVLNAHKGVDGKVAFDNLGTTTYQK